MFSHSIVLLLYLITKTELATVSCPYGGYIDILSYQCYVDMYLSTFDETVKMCNSFYNGYPPIIHSQKDWNAFLHDMQFFGWHRYILKNYLVALTGNYSESWWMGYNDGEWLDGFNSSFTEYNGTDIPAKLVINWPNGTWTKPETIKAGALCVYQGPFFCSGFYDLVNENCFWPAFLIQKQTYSWAVQQCLTFKYVIAAIHSNRANEFAYSSLMTSYFKQPLPSAWLGYVPGSGGKWNDSSPYNYTNYVTNFDKSRLLDPDYCMIMILLGRNAGKWDMILCTQKQGIGLCMTP